jgi:hypothetical protein
MKRLFTVLMLMLALNFIAVAGGVGWLVQGGRLDKAKVKQIREIIFPTSQPSTKPTSASAATQPSMRLDELLARQTGRTATEQVNYIQNAFDMQMREMDNRQNELQDLQRQVDLASQKLAADRQAFQQEKDALTKREQEADTLQSDKGFQDTLALYIAMPPKQVKSIFLTLGEATVQQYLEAMQPKTATKITREFQTPEEMAFIQRVLERMRQAKATTLPQESVTQDATAGAGSP